MPFETPTVSISCPLPSQADRSPPIIDRSKLFAARISPRYAPHKCISLICMKIRHTADRPPSHLPFFSSLRLSLPLLLSTFASKALSGTYEDLFAFFQNSTRCVLGFRLTRAFFFSFRASLAACKLRRTHFSSPQFSLRQCLEFVKRETKIRWI